jgi:hypothetical protein
MHSRSNPCTRIRRPPLRNEEEPPDAGGSGREELRRVSRRACDGGRPGRGARRRRATWARGRRGPDGKAAGSTAAGSTAAGSTAAGRRDGKAAGSTAAGRWDGKEASRSGGTWGRRASRGPSGSRSTAAGTASRSDRSTTGRRTTGSSSGPGRRSGSRPRRGGASGRPPGCRSGAGRSPSPRPGPIRTRANTTGWRGRATSSSTRWILPFPSSLGGARCSRSSRVFPPSRCGCRTCSGERQAPEGAERPVAGRGVDPFLPASGRPSRSC